MYYLVKGKVVLEGWWTLWAADSEDAKKQLLLTLPDDTGIGESMVTTSEEELEVYEFHS